MSTTSPSSSTARLIYTRPPVIVETISSRRRRGHGGSSRRRRLAASFGPNSLSRRGPFHRSLQHHDARASLQHRGNWAWSESRARLRA